MFIATDSNNNNVHINDAQPQERYFCPICGAPLIIRAADSAYKQKHFAHRNGTYCTDDWQYEMTVWHMAWQEKFPIECREVVMGHAGEKHRADVFINNTIIEFQHSSISYDDFTRRNTFYLKLGYKIVWIFNVRNKIKDSLKELVAPVNQNIQSVLLYFKRPQNQFRDFDTTYPSGVSMAIYLETHYAGIADPILISLRKVDHTHAWARWTYPYITPQNFLKEYHALDDANTLSIADIVDNTYELHKTLQRRGMAIRR